MFEKSEQTHEKNATEQVTTRKPNLKDSKIITRFRTSKSHASIKSTKRPIESEKEYSFRTEQSDLISTKSSIIGLSYDSTVEANLFESSTTITTNIIPSNATKMLPNTTTESLDTELDLKEYNKIELFNKARHSKRIGNFLSENWRFAITKKTKYNNLF
jgi:hypothetical protein